MPSSPGERSQIGAMVSLRYNLTTSTTYGKKINYQLHLFWTKYFFLPIDGVVLIKMEKCIKNYLLLLLERSFFLVRKTNLLLLGSKKIEN